MPELPEVETIVRKLQPILTGKILESIAILHPKSFQGEPTLLSNLKILQVTRRAKIIRVQFENSLNLILHLKMTGQAIYVDQQRRLGGGHPTSDWITQLPGKHTRVILTFLDGSHLYFNDQRLFGWMKLVTDEEVEKLFSALAPDVIDDQVTPDFLANKIKNRTQAIKVLMMDTAIMSGLGNIYACDALNQARLHPERPGKSLTGAEIAVLLEASKDVLNRGVELGGTTFDGKYVDIDGLAGEYQTVARVYGRAGKACHNCGATIVKIKQGGRGTYYCPTCQV
jgi:formamidopyrimidine-DNA glycosylase